MLLNRICRIYIIAIKYPEVKDFFKKTYIKQGGMK